MRYAKGHGTGNDFVIVPDVDDSLDLSADLVRRLCDRRTGIGADGVLRVVRSASEDAPWFMDYRNADGSIAEMCGNGIRVFARYLLDHGLAAGPDLPIGTRAGIRLVRQVDEGRFSVGMGAAAIGWPSAAMAGGRRWSGLTINVGNPHLACLVDEPLAGINLSVPPEVDRAAFPEGVNVEFVRMTGPRMVRMRVHERGSGETLSCGTGAVAAAVAAAHAAGEWPDGDAEWVVDVPGGRLTVIPDQETSILAGPAVIVAEGEIDASWLAACVPAEPAVR